MPRCLDLAALWWRIAPASLLSLLVPYGTLRRLYTALLAAPVSRLLSPRAQLRPTRARRRTMSCCVRPSRGRPSVTGRPVSRRSGAPVKLTPGSIAF
ncbi:hypothetical protein PLICRDRAFT_656803 [Plicaturopsis crispa FD-325 SS-3]|nr:hypothetical protein PLICRDRAFT_656803 [Plicaturopsis crispa FD-325 SS-3]